MKQYTNEIQTAKLIELGLPKPKSMNGEHNGWQFMPTPAYSIGELIEMLSNDDLATTRFEYDMFNWFVDWDSFDKIHRTAGVELIDALYAMILQLKEEGVINVQPHR